MVGPFLWMVLGSIKPDSDFLRNPPTFLPSAPTTDNYSRLFDQLDFPRFFFNSAVVALAVTVGNLIFCPMLGYALAKLRGAASGWSWRSSSRRSWCRPGSPSSRTSS